MIFFDLDNTLVDYSTSEKKAINSIMESYKISTEDYAKIWKDISSKYFSQYLSNNLSFEKQGAMRIMEFFKAGDKIISFGEAKTIFYEYKTQLEAGWMLFDDVKTCLDRLSEEEKGIASNGEMSQQKNKLQVTDIEKYFVVKKYASEMKTAKPDYCFFEKLKKYSSNNKYIYVGDDLATDIYPCMELGINAIWLNRNNSDIPNDVTAINSLNELPDLLDI